MCAFQCVRACDAKLNVDTGLTPVGSHDCGSSDWLTFPYPYVSFYRRLVFGGCLHENYCPADV